MTRRRATSHCKNNTCFDRELGGIYMKYPRQLKEWWLSLGHVNWNTWNRLCKVAMIYLCIVWASRNEITLHGKASSPPHCCDRKGGTPAWVSWLLPDQQNPWPHPSVLGGIQPLSHLHSQQEPSSGLVVCMDKNVPIQILVSKIPTTHQQRVIIGYLWQKPECLAKSVQKQDIATWEGVITLTLSS